MNLAEEAFIETYVAVNKNPISSIPFLSKIVLNIEIERNCMLMFFTTLQEMEF